MKPLRHHPARTAETHVFVAEPIIPAESLILRESLASGKRVLDIGCAATGRSARLARTFGASVCSIDVNLDSIRKFCARDDGRGIEVVQASVEDLPFRDRFFDMVLVALHGLDYLEEEERPQRTKALREASRVLKPEGRLVFNSNNPIGSILSPRSFANRTYLRWRLRQVARGGFLRESLIDLNGLKLYQATPSRVIRSVERTTDLKFVYALNRGGNTKSLPLLTLFSGAPYYVFRR